MKQSFLSFRGLFVVVLAVSSPDVLAATPVDIFQDMESGRDGDLLTRSFSRSCKRGGRGRPHGA